jgi:membrane-bound metal-dependent hydrolase YbcI (DUF457 family)
MSTVHHIWWHRISREGGPVHRRHRTDSGGTSLAAFGTHLAVGVTVSGLAATAAYAGGLASPAQMLFLLGLGTAGSLAPDLDSDRSAPVRVLFTLLSLSGAFAVLFAAARHYPTVAELAVIWLVSFLLLRWAVFALLQRLTRHRGMFHSVPAALLAGSATAALLFQLGGRSPTESWMAGAFVTFGYLVHLILDELCSLNVFGSRARRSLGTALKLWSSRSAGATLWVYALCFGALALAPDPRHVFPEVLASVSPARWLPSHGWFGRGPDEARDFGTRAVAAIAPWVVGLRQRAWPDQTP